MCSVLRLDLYSSSKTKTKDILLSLAPTIPSAIKGWVENVGGSVCVCRGITMNQTEFIISAYMYSVFMCLCRGVLEAGVCWLEYCCDIYYSTISSHILAV